MSALIYNFDDQLEKGERIELALDEHFQSLGARVLRAKPEHQRVGVDRWFKLPFHIKAEPIPVEYKADWKATETGNVFLEFISVMRGDIIESLGWVTTSRAEWLFYCLPESGYVLHVEFSRLRKEFCKWEKQFPKKKVKNQGYVSWGVPVPLEVFGEISIRQIKLNFG